MNSPSFRKRLKRGVRYALLRVAIAAAQHFPIGWAKGLGALFGDVVHFVAAGERKKALASLERAYPNLPVRERRALARACFRHLARMLFELAAARQLTEAQVRWPAPDRAVLDAALARGKGVVFVSGHVGNWELLARWVSLAGYPCQTIAKETSDPRTTKLIEDFRASSKLKSIWRDRDGVAKAMLGALKAGEILGMLIDQDTDVQSVWVPFFGHRAKTPRAAADLALRTGAAIVLGFCTRAADGGYTLAMRELPADGRDAEALTAAMTAEIERVVRADPTQWVWMHQRWKSQ